METEEVSDLALQFLFEELNRRLFDGKLRARVIWNNRLKRTGARVSLQDDGYLIEVSSLQYQYYGWSEVRKLLLHEMAHISAGLFRSHRSPLFRMELERIGGARYARPIPDEKRTKGGK